MDIVDENEIVMRCYKCDHQLLDNLSLVYNASNSMVVLWNKFQIFVYENLEFESAAKIIAPEFQIHRLLITNNYLVCLDCSGNVHVTSLKFKNTTQKRFKSNFHPRDKSIAACVRLDQDNAISLKFEYGSYFLCLNRINSDFQSIKKSMIICDCDLTLLHLTNRKLILSTFKVSESNIECIKRIFSANENVGIDSSLVIISFDMLTVYGCLFSGKIVDEEIVLVQLYTCPSEICNVEVIDEGCLNIVIGLSIGTLIKLSLNDQNKDPQIIHLNIALNKFHIVKDTITYSDGTSFWKSEKIFSDDIKLNQFFVKHVKDFIMFGDQIICTTFSKLTYVFPTDDERVYLKPDTLDEYCPAEKLLNNSEYLYRIIEEIEKSNDVVKKLNEETNYITALSLSNRQDIMNNVIKVHVEMYENYEDVIKENEELTLTDEMVEYFIPDSYLFLVKLTTSSIQHMFGHILSNIFGDVKIHITLCIENKILKTTSIKVLEQLKKLNILIPLKANIISNQTQINIQIRIVSNVPGSLDEKETIWTVLYRTNTELNSEHFIKTNLISNKNIYLKEWQREKEELIYKTVLNQYGNMFKITDITKHKTVGTEWSLYVKLPNNYEEIFKTEDCRQYLNAKKANYLIQQFSSEEFLKSKSNISLSIGNDKVKLEIINDSFSNPLLKVTSENIKIAFNIRNFIANMIYNDFKNTIEFINNTFYTTVENLQKSIKDCIASSAEVEAYLPLIEQFERNVIGALPL